MAYGYNAQGQLVWQDSDTPQGGTALPTSQITGRYVAPTYDGPNDPSRRDYLKKLGGGSVWETIRGPAPWGMKYNAAGELVPTSAWDKFDTAFNDVGIYGTLGMAGAAGAVAGAGALGSAFGGGAGAGAGGGAGGAGTGLALTPEGALLPAAGAGGGIGGAGGTAGLILGSGAPGAATVGVPTSFAPAFGLAGGGGAGAGAAAAAAGGHSMLQSILPTLITAGMSLFGNRQTAAEKAQAAAIDQQRQYLAYQQQKQQAMDPIQDALIRMAMGMMPTYSQGLFSNYSGLPGVSAPNGAARNTTPGIGGGGYGGNTGPSRR